MVVLFDRRAEEDSEKPNDGGAVILRDTRAGEVRGRMTYKYPLQNTAYEQNIVATHGGNMLPCYSFSRRSPWNYRPNWPRGKKGFSDRDFFIQERPETMVR